MARKASVARVWIRLRLRQPDAPAQAPGPRDSALRARPGEGRAPEYPPILDYRPRSTLVVPRIPCAFWKLYGMGLPDDVLKNLYYKNALALLPGLDRQAFPE